MMRATSVLLFVFPAALILLSLAGCSEKPIQPSMLDTTDDAYKYRYWCAGCHGLDGKGVGQVSDLRGYDSTFKKFSKTLDDGPGLMPHFPQLDSATRFNIYLHVKTF